MTDYVATTLEEGDRVLVLASVWNLRDMTSIPCKVTRVEETERQTRVFVIPEDTKHTFRWVKASDIFVKLREEVKVIY